MTGGGAPRPPRQWSAEEWRAVDVPRLLAELEIDATRDGEQWRARCPFHEEKTPSWSITDKPGDKRHGLSHCFGCKAGGGVVALVADKLGISRHGAVDWMRENAMGSFEVEQVRVTVGALGRAAFRLPEGVVVAPLAQWPDEPAAYVAGRGITAEQVERYRVGYAIEGKLARRIIFPAIDSYGALLNYAARTYAQHPKRYLTASREEGPRPGAIFGEIGWSWTDMMRVVTEGAINALAAERAVGYPVGALLGSDVQLNHVMKVANVAKSDLDSMLKVYLLTDPDLAGDRAAEKLYGALCRHADVRRVCLRPGTDAASIPPKELREAFHRADLANLG